MKVELSVTTLFRLLDKANLGEPHVIFAGGARYYSPRFQQETDARLRRELDAAGVNGPRGVAPDFLDLLSVIQRAAVEYFGYFHDAEGPYSVVTAAVGRQAVLAERVENTVTFERVEPTRLLDAFLFRLPNVPAARGESISVRLSDLDAPKSDGFARSAGPPQARRLQELMKQPRLGGAKLYTAKRDQRGKRLRAADWITAIDVQQGRWAVYKTSRGESSVTAVPGTPQLIATRMRELQDTIK
ncbi:ESX secretion-associated protein EspG [Actinokineospora xionganensis]|uniref:ESX secretion-associated protein EspG n=1 Tax=Actinokineospora xionganensis TaxID=2684470 RepID=A0ABR7L9N3_9PSEU|nr:ESX secretion-associated protein EspG [Actinokineospora xionganensis]MBC6449106.1 ESX secretion-associated protein EspG [Actinokineospora xionganensis]